MELPRELIDPDADKVVRRLARRGHKAYLVGGCVRDLLLGHTPKDFDVATSATPNEIKALFRNCRIIGRRFRLAHIFFGPKIIETSTFRANPRDDADADAELYIRRDNVFGSETEDAQRRDFTINGLFYDVETSEVIDHVDGLDDLEQRLVRTIGDPDIRFREDPVRMLRAIKFAARLDLRIEDATWAALLRHREELTKCAPPRLLEEVYRMLRSGSATRSLELLIETSVAAVLSPQLAALFCTDVADIEDVVQQVDLSPEQAEWAATWNEDLVSPGRPMLSADLEHLHDPDQMTGRRQLGWKLLRELDGMAKRGGKISNALALATLVNAFVFEDVLSPNMRSTQASEIVMDVLGPIAEQLRMARRDIERVRQMLLAQRRLAPSRRRRGRPGVMVSRDYFEDALSLYELTSRALGKNTEDVEHWRQLAREGSGERADGDEQDSESSSTTTKRRRRRRGGRRRRRDSETGDEATVS